MSALSQALSHNNAIKKDDVSQCIAEVYRIGRGENDCLSEESMCLQRAGEFPTKEAYYGILWE